MDATKLSSGIKFRIKRGSLSKAFFLILLLEVFLGGAGRLTTLGPLTLRMYLFIIGMMLFIFCFFFAGKKLMKATIIIMGMYLALMAIGIVCGLVNSSDYSLLLADVKMLSFFLILPLFDLMIKDKNMVERIIRLLKLSTLIMAAAYLIFLVILHLEIIPFLTLYDAMSKPEYFDEFGFRGQSAVIYKGFIFMCVGYFFFLFNKRSFRNNLNIILVFSAILLTLARAYILLIFLLTLFPILHRFLFARKNKILNMVVISVVIITAIALVPTLLEIIGDKSTSDNIRVVQLRQVGQMVNPMSVFIGHGFGVGVPIRPGHMEIMYLEIFHKQGLLGLAFWFFILTYILFKYNRYRTYCKKMKIESAIDTRPFVYGTIFLYLQSLFNPYLTNSMGMTFLFITLIVFERLKTFNEQKDLGLHSDI